MTAIKFRTVQSNNIDMHLAEAGTGPLVVMLHGFPESWYSWRHQLPALAAAGYHAVALDMRGYGGSGKPAEIDAYNIRQLTADVIGVIDAMDQQQAVVIGHDWGAPVAWHCALLHASRVSAVGAMSVPYRPRGGEAPIGRLKEIFGERFFYQLYFQQPGRAEAEFEADIRGFVRKFLYLASGDAPPQSGLVAKTKKDLMLTGLIDPEQLPPWLTPEDIDFYVGEFQRNGLSGPLNWYRNIDRNWHLTADVEDFRIHQPALFIAGESDPVLYFAPNQIEIMKENLDDLRDLLLLPGCGHWTQQERPEQVNAALLQFLKGL